MNITCITYFEIKKLVYCFYYLCTYFYCYRHFITIIKFCYRLSLFVFVFFNRYLHTSKIPLSVNMINFLFFYGYYWNYKIALLLAVILVLFNWHTGKTNTPILLYIMQHPRYFLIFGINLNEFAVSKMYHLHVELSINFRNPNF